MDARSFWSSGWTILLATVVRVGGFPMPMATADVFSMSSGQSGMEFVPVGNAGNAPDTQYSTPGYGAVDRFYQIGKSEATAGQYTAFLNAVAGIDTYGLYNTNMWSGSYSCQIQRSGGGTKANPYTYSVAGDWANRPVNYVSWGDAARFVNWLTNGQPTGAQDSSTTEDGSYALNGATTDDTLLAVTRKASARYVIPSEDEWYKAGYHDPSKPGGVAYWEFPTRSSMAPSNILSATGTNNANYYDSYGTGSGGYTIGAQYYRTEVGSFVGSSSPYGTYDQGGNVWEWNEAVVFGAYRGLRGGSFFDDGSYLQAAARSYNTPTNVDYGVGFRVVALFPRGDLNGDWHVDAADLLILAGSWGRSAGEPGFVTACDLNDDSRVNVVDLLILADNWGT